MRRRKNPAASEPPRCFLKEGEEGEMEVGGLQRDCWHHLYTSFVFQPSSLHSEAGVLSVPMKREQRRERERNKYLVNRPSTTTLLSSCPH